MILNIEELKEGIELSYINEGKIHVEIIPILDKDKYVWKYCDKETKFKSWDDKYITKIKSNTLTKFRIKDIIKDNINHDVFDSKLTKQHLNYITMDKRNNKIIILLQNKVVVIGNRRFDSSEHEVIYIKTLTFSESILKLTNIVNKVKEPFMIWSSNEYKMYHDWLLKKYRRFTNYIFCYEDIYLKYDKSIRVKDSNNILDINNKLFSNNKFEGINVNIVEILKFKQIEDRLQLFTIMISIANISKCPLKKTHSSIEIAENLLYEYFLRKGKRLPYKRSVNKQNSYPGGFTELYKKGKHQNVLYLDFNSMYPNIIRQFGISPENYLSKVNSRVLCSGVKFSNTPNTSLPDIYDTLISKRNKIIELKNNEENKKKKQYLESYEKAIKECNNALYGCFGNTIFYFSSTDIAKTITIQARDVLQYSIDKLNIRLNKLLKTSENYVLYNDTDSMMVDCDLLKSKTTKWKEVIVKLCDEILASYAEKWKTDNRLKLKIENTFKSLYLTSKKRYFFIDETDKFNVTGLKSIHSTSSKFLQNKMNELLQSILTQDVDKRFVIDYCKKNKRVFSNENIESISDTYKVTRYSNFIIDDLNEITVKEDTPNELIACAIYNNLVYKNNLTHKYKIIEDGDKVRWYHTTNEKFPFFAYIPKKYPYEIAPNIDYNKQYDSSFFNNINQLLGIIEVAQIQKSELIF